MSDLAEVRRWRDELRLSPEIEGGMLHGWSRDVDTLLKEIDRLAELEAIVRDLAATLINAATPEALTVVRERARDWVSAHPVSGTATDG